MTALPAQSPAPAQLTVTHLRKEYPGTVALNDVTVTFTGGHIHALIGKNGAGKSTLVKILAGAVRPTSGELLLNGSPLQFASPHDALSRGIAAVHQELSLVPELTVAENILLGRLPQRAGYGGHWVDWNATFTRAEQILSDLGVAIDVRRKAGRLGVAQQQLVEIAKAMSYNPAVLMLDEPTSALAQRETDHLFMLVRQLAARGVVVLYISHRLQELRRVADTVSVLRDGSLVGTIDISEATPQKLVQLMFGETVQRTRPEGLVASNEPVMEVRHLTREGAFNDVSFTLYKGEVLGIAGLLGAGRTELLRAIFGADPPNSGEVAVGGTSVLPRNPRQMKELGLALTPENRKEEGLVQIASTRVNICLAALRRIAHGSVTTRAKEREVAGRFVQELDIRVADIESPVASLSGGNQQKVVAGKWLATSPRVILFDEPTRGIDVQAKQQMFQIIWDLSRRGVSSVMVSSELEELLEVCHRILIMREGRITGSVEPDAISLEHLFARCMGS